jgi:CRP/FNR family cyclic AMP-dependent transcriptional regulator
MTHEVNLATLGRLLGVVDVVSVCPGNFLFREGDAAAALYIVRSGVLQIVGDDVIYETVTAGGVVGELAIADEGKRSASVLASTHAELWAVDTPGFLALVKADPEFALTIMRVMTRRLRTMNLRYRMAVHNDQFEPHRPPGRSP